MLSSIRRQRAVLEVERRKNRESTFTQGIQCSASEDPAEFDQLTQSLTVFYRTIYHRQAEIRDILETEASVAAHYQNLVNTTKQVTMEEFWQRYFYRCDVERLLQQWERRDATARMARAEVFAGSFSSVSKLAKSWSEKAVSATTSSSSSRNLSGGGAGTSTPKSDDSPKSLPSSPARKNSKSLDETNEATTTITFEETEAFVTTKFENTSDASSKGTFIVKNNSEMTDSPKAKEEKEEEESLVFVDDEPTSQPTRPTVSTTTSDSNSANVVTPTTTRTSRILDLLKDDEDTDATTPSMGKIPSVTTISTHVKDDDIAAVAQSENKTAATATTITTMTAASSSSSPSLSPSSAVMFPSQGLLFETNISNSSNAADTEPKLSKLTPTTKLTLDSPPSSPSAPSLFREWSRGRPEEETQSTSPPSPSPHPQQQSRSNSAVRRSPFRVQDRLSQMEKLEASLSSKSLLRFPKKANTSQELKDSTEKPNEVQQKQQSGPSPLNAVLRDWNSNPVNEETTTKTTASGESTSSDEEVTDSKSQPDETNAGVSDSHAPPYLQLADAAPSAPDESKNADSVDNVTATTATASRSEPTVLDSAPEPSPVKQPLPEDSPETSNATPHELNEVAEPAPNSNSSDEFGNRNPEDETKSTKDSTAVSVSALEPRSAEVLSGASVAGESEETEESIPRNNVESTDIPSKLDTSISSSDSCTSAMTSDTASLEPSQPPSLDTTKDNQNIANEKQQLPTPQSHEIHDEATPHCSNPFTAPTRAAAFGKPTRSWLLSISGMAVLVGLAVLGKVAWVWATTTPNGIRFIDTLCAPAQSGTKLPLEGSDGDVSTSPVHSFEAPWWAPPAYKKKAFDLICASTTNTGMSRKQIRLEWTTPNHVPQVQRRNGKNKSKQEKMHRLIISSQADDGIAVDVVYDAWLASAVVEATEIQTEDKRGTKQTVANLWTAG